MIQFKVFQKAPDIKKAAKLCLKKEFYVKGWALEEFYKNPDNISEVIIAYEGKKPIGCCVHGEITSEINIATFVTPDKRRRGFGSQLVSLAKNGKTSLKAGLGVVGSMTFWNKNGIEVD
jgi:hypothetical protein